MGATEFVTRGNGATAEEAFAAARDEAQYMYGHGGYSGTIAEKGSFTMMERGRRYSSEEGVKYVDLLLDANDRRIADKWGPAGCIQLEDNGWLFFGHASC